MPSSQSSELSSSSAGPATPPTPLELNLNTLQKQQSPGEVAPDSAKTLRPPARNDSADVPDVPKQLQDGITMLKVSAKKVVQRRVRIASEVGQVFWESRTGGVLNIELIRELRFGADARGYREALGRAKDSEARWTSIIYASSADKKIKVLHLVALTADVFASWQKCLTALYEQRKALMGGLDQMRRRQSVWLRQQWKMAEAGDEGKLEFAEVARLCKSLGIAARQDELRAHFEAADVQRQGYLDFAAFQAFVRLLKHRPEVDQLLKSYSGGARFLSLDHFVAFMRTAQRSMATFEALATVYRKFCDRHDEGMTTEGLASFLLSTENSAFAEHALKVSQDMHRPLCEYFISSSHNTYLLGSQLKGESTTEGYVRALQQGCRTVELDVWDGPAGQPVVYHGRTLTKKIPARDILLAVAKYAFVASPYPVILSMEIHCDLPQQAQLARTLRETLGDSLVTKPLFDEQSIIELPCPDQLRYRFLVKAKNIAAVMFSGQITDEPLSLDEGDVSSSSASSDASELRNKLGSALRRFRSDSNPRVPSVSSSPQASPDLNRRSMDLLPPPPSSSSGSNKPPKLGRELAELLVYTVGVKCRGFNKKEQYAATHVLSLSERRAAKTIKETADELIAYNRTHLMRTYPSISRFTSSNFLPQNMWAVGMQMVAINWQTFDLGAEINAAMFQRNGKTGYVLKPDVLRFKGPTKDKDLLASPIKYRLNVKVISAQQLSRARTKDGGHPVLDHAKMSPCVEVGIFAPAQATVPRRRTAIAQGNGFNPVFADSTFALPFEVVGGMLDLVFLRFQVFDDDPDGPAVGRYCIPVGSLAPGYRHVPLYDDLGQQYLFSSLFVHTQLERLT